MPSAGEGAGGRSGDMGAGSRGGSFAARAACIKFDGNTSGGELDGCVAGAGYRSDWSRLRPRVAKSEGGIRASIKTKEHTAGIDSSFKFGGTFEVLISYCDPRRERRKFWQATASAARSPSSGKRYRSRQCSTSRPTTRAGAQAPKRRRLGFGQRAEGCRATKRLSGQAADLYCPQRLTPPRRHQLIAPKTTPSF